jgi:hypothetical protein
MNEHDKILVNKVKPPCFQVVFKLQISGFFLKTKWIWEERLFPIIRKDLGYNK